MTLQSAIKTGDLEELKRLLIQEPNSIEGDADGIWLPFYAARLGNLDIVRYIVEYSRASFNTVDSKNRDVLHYGVESGNLQMVKYLVERVGMSPVRGDANLITPYDIAHEKGYREIESYFEGVCGCRLSDMYRNPIRTGMYPDPSIVCVGEDFYMVNSSFVFFPCIPISHSKDLIHWEVIGHAITNPKWAYLDDLEGGRGYWAPDISYYEGKYYITATYRLNDTGTVYRKQMVVSSDRPEGPYCEPVFLDEDGIDPSIFTDDDGKRYMLLNRGARIFEISPDGKQQMSEARLLYYGHQKRAPEGSHLLKKDGWYYLFQAEGGTGPGHRISVARSATLFGTYEPCPYNPIMRQNDEMAGIQRCGHGKPVQTPNGEWYMVYLCGRQIDGAYSMLGRETAMDPIDWDKEGWPMVNRLQGPSVLQKKPNLQEWIPTEQGDMLEEGRLGHEWMTPRPPTEGGILVEDGWIRIEGSQKPISSMHAKNILLRRQKNFVFSLSAQLKVPSLSEGQHMGLIGYYDENTYVSYSLIQRNGKYALQIIEHIGDDTRVFLESNVEELSVDAILELKMDTDYLKRTFSYRIPERSETYKETGILENVYYLCDEGISRGKRFTGAMAGVYVYAKEGQTLYGYYRKVKEWRK